jgi:endo-1,4-beta-D-glucanase Y
MKSLKILALLSLAPFLTLTTTCSTADLWKPSLSAPSFMSSYEQWKDPQNTFVHYIDEEDQARVIFIGSQAYDRDNNGRYPTASEGMGYGLLLAYANNDQILFDKFLRYIIVTANNHGCSLLEGESPICSAKDPFLMPWLVNESGEPFWYQTSPKDEARYTSGSASDADFQIAWAVYLASKAAEKGRWDNNTFHSITGVITYAELFHIMGKAIRLGDIDLDTLRYVPGNQWGAKGSKVLYSGYMTPQAFDALATIPPLDVSDICPEKPPIQPPFPSSLLLVYKNNLIKTVSVDYLAGSGPVEAKQNFILKPRTSSGYTVSGATTAIAVVEPDEAQDNTVFFQATLYDENGQPQYWVNYEFEYIPADNEQLSWKATDKGSSPEAKVCLVDNIAYVFLTQPDIHKVNFKWSEIKSNSLLTVQSFQETHNTGLFPNTIYDDDNYPETSFNRSFGHDAIRFPLWVAPYAYATPSHNNKVDVERSIIEALLSTRGVASFIRTSSLGNTMPYDGIDVFAKTALGGYSSAPPALNAPLALAAFLSENQTLYNTLVGSIGNYQITEHQPKFSDPEGDSSPYFNAAILLLTEAFFNNKL